MAQQSAQAQLSDIDRDLDQLVDITNRQRVGATEIGDELRAQDEMIKDVDRNMDRTQNKVNEAVLTTQDIKNHKMSCVAWILSAIFLILIFVVLFAWKK